MRKEKKIKIKLLRDIEDTYVGGGLFKAGKIYKVPAGDTRNTSKILYCGGHGLYVYAEEGEYEIVSE
jgi:hypothetical protein